MLLEELIIGVEITVPILGDKALPVVEIVPPEGGVFDYENKYNGKTRELCPPENVHVLVGELLEHDMFVCLGFVCVVHANARSLHYSAHTRRFMPLMHACTRTYAHTHADACAAPSWGILVRTREILVDRCVCKKNCQNTCLGNGLRARDNFLLRARLCQKKLQSVCECMKAGLCVLVW
jgi:hypothetical protein